MKNTKVETYDDVFKYNIRLDELKSQRVKFQEFTKDGKFCLAIIKSERFTHVNIEPEEKEAVDTDNSINPLVVLPASIVAFVIIAITTILS